MASSRRGLLATGAVVAVTGGGVVGYAQRRRLLRYADLRTLRGTRDRPIPEQPDPLVVPDSQLADSRERLDDLVRRARERGVSAAESGDGNGTDHDFAYALERRERAAERTASIAAAYDLVSARRYAIESLSRARLEVGDLTEADVEADVADVRERAEETTLAYDLEPETHLVVTHHGAELALRSAGVALGRTDRDEPVDRTGFVEEAHALLDLADVLSNDGEEPGDDGDDGNRESRESDLRALDRRLETEIDARLSAVTHDIDPDYVRSRYEIIGYVGSPRTLVSNPSGLFGRSPADYEDESPASTVVTRLRNLVLATVTTEFADRKAGSDAETSAIDIEELGEQKRRATDAIESVPDDVAADPLGRLFVAAAVHAADCGDTQLERAIENVNRAESGRWDFQQEGAYLGYRTAVELAQEAPEQIARVESL